MNIKLQGICKRELARNLFWVNGRIHALRILDTHFWRYTIPEESPGIARCLNHARRQILAGKITGDIPAIVQAHFERRQFLNADLQAQAADLQAQARH